MRVIVSDAIVRSVSQTHDAWKLHRLMGFVVEGRHAIVFEAGGSLPEWLNTIDAFTKSAYVSSLTFATRALTTFPADAATVKIDVVEQAAWQDPIAVLSLDEALTTLGEPLGVLVENAENDWHFLCGMMLESERQRTKYLLGKGWLVPVHGGGQTLIDQLNGRLSFAPKGLRTFVMFDSDRLHPDELHPNWTTARPGQQPASCQAYDWEPFIREVMPMRYWMLSRRFIESYMPQAELIAAGADKDAVTALFSLPSNARWYFNMKAGLAKDAKRHDPERSRNLFDALEVEDREKLKFGLVKNLANHYANSATREFDWDSDARQEARNSIPKLIRLF
jgi:hypothetical protein